MVVATPLMVVTKSVVMVVTDFENEVENEVDDGEGDEGVEVASLDDDDSVVGVVAVVDGVDEVVVVGGVVVGVVRVLLVLWLVVVGVEDVVWEVVDVECEVVEEDVDVDLVDSEFDVVDDELEFVCRFSTTFRACSSIGSAETTTARRTRSRTAAISSVGRLHIFSSLCLSC